MFRRSNISLFFKKYFRSDVHAFDNTPSRPPLYRRSPDHVVTFIRHGQSEWNDKGLFTGWYDARLTGAGYREAEKAGSLLKREAMCFDVVYVSRLQRSQRTARAVLEGMGKDILLQEDWRLNERHYGALTGLNKEQTTQQLGKELICKWRRSFEAVPPLMNDSHPYYQSIASNYEDLNPRMLPRAESLKMTMNRVVRFWLEKVVPALRSGNKVLIVAHSNSLRAIIKYLDNISDKGIKNYEVPTALPFMYTLDAHMRPVRNKRLQFFGTLKETDEARRQIVKKLKK